jgi:hemoglobin-like flavoprotein
MSVSPEDIELFNDSLERCTSHTEFLTRFYERFVASSPEVAEKFKNTDFTRQRRVLKSSLYLLIFATEGKPEGTAHMEGMNELHGPKHLNIPAYMYDLWLDSLIKTVQEFDVGFSPRVEKAWRSMLAAGIEYMKAPR